MKYIFFFLLLSTTLLAQRGGEVKSDTIYFGKTKNECGDSVYTLTAITTYRGGRTETVSQPVGFSENDPCSGVRVGDTATLVNFYANPMIDFGRQQAQKALDFIFQARTIRRYRTVTNALQAFHMPSPLAKIEAMFADSLVGDYILVRPGVANANVTVTKTNQGAVRIRVSAQTNFPLVVYSDGFMTARNIAGTNQDVDLYQIEKGRWVSLIGSYQLVKQARQVVQRGVK